MPRAPSITQRIKRREQVAAWRLEGKTLVDIAKLAGVDRQTVHADLKVIERQWIDEAKLSYIEKCREKEADLLRVRNQAWDAYFLTCTKKRPEGDPRFLKIAASCDERIIRLYSLHDAEVFARNEMISSGESQVAGDVQVMEVVVETREQVRTIVSFGRFQEMTGSEVIDAEPVADQGDPDGPASQS